MAHASIAVPGSVAIDEPSPAPQVALSAAADASIAAYVAAGERMRIVASWLGLAGLVLLAAIAVAWALDLLPVAVNLF